MSKVKSMEHGQFGKIDNIKLLSSMESDWFNGPSSPPLAIGLGALPVKKQRLFSKYTYHFGQWSVNRNKLTEAYKSNVIFPLFLPHLCYYYEKDMSGTACGSLRDVEQSQNVPVTSADRQTTWWPVRKPCQDRESSFWMHKPSTSCYIL